MLRYGSEGREVLLSEYGSDAGAAACARQEFHSKRQLIVSPNCIPGAIGHHARTAQVVHGHVGRWFRRRSGWFASHIPPPTRQKPHTYVVTTRLTNLIPCARRTLTVH